MIKYRLELCEQVACDTLTGEVVEKSVYIKSNLRDIYIGINTILDILDFLREKGIQI